MLSNVADPRINGSRHNVDAGAQYRSSHGVRMGAKHAAGG
jgi:hypothetical protein